MKCILCESDNTRIYRVVDNYNIVKCRNDGLIFVSPQPSINEYRKFYNRDYFLQGDGVEAGYGYRDYLSETNIYQRNSCRVLREIERLKPDKGRILDIGCAFGFLVRCAQMRGWDAVGVEFNEEVSRWARDNLKVKVFTGTTDKCRFPDNYFDVVCFIGVIEHFLNPFEELKEAVRILKKGGLVWIITGDVDKVIGGRFLKPPEHLYYFSRYTMEKLLIKAGLSMHMYKNYFRFFSIQGFIVKIFYYIYKLSGWRLLKHVGRYISSIVKLLRIGNFPVILPSGQMLIVAKKR